MAASWWHLSVATAVAATITTAAAVSVTEFASTPMEGAAVASFVEAGSFGPSSPAEPALLTTTFSPTTTSDNIFLLPSLAAVKAGSVNVTVGTVDGAAVWPNQADAFSSESNTTATGALSAGVLSAGGFFVNVPGYPSKATGSVDIFTPGSSSNAKSVALRSASETFAFEKQQISTDKSSFFYHKAAFLDADGDGRSDVIAARCYVPKYGIRKDQSELLWLERPAAGSGSDAAWTEHVLLSSGPDVSFVLVDLDGGDGSTRSPQVVATEYFVNQQLALYWCDGDTWSECGEGGSLSAVSSAVIDDTEGAMFNLQWVDLNGDGTKDLLVTSQGDNGEGLVLAYERPAGDWRVPGAAWTKHVLADGYKPLKAYLPGRGSPGTAVAFDYPSTSSSSSSSPKPWVVVSADDGGWVDMLVPTSPSDPSNWEYAKTRVVQSTGTVGTPAVGDVDGDGTPELFVPLYDEGRLAMYSIDV